MLALACYVGAGNVALSQFIKFPPIAPKSQGVTGVTIDVVHGIPPNTIITNVTARTSINAAGANAVTFQPLPAGSTNHFYAFNPAGGRSPTLTAVATNQVIASRISVHSYRVVVPVKPGSSTRVMMSTNLLTWYQIALVLSTNTTYQFIWTNDGAPSRWFRTVSP